MSPSPSLPAPVLDHLVRELAEAHADSSHATLVRARPTPSGVDVGLCSLPEGVHPAEALVGHVVPEPWAASGVVAPARARPLEEAAATGTGTPTTVAMLVGRDGHVTSCALGVEGVDSGAEAPVGRIPDLLLRTFALPTPPPPVPAVEWWRAHWLDALVSVAADNPGEEPDPENPLTSTLPPELVHALVDDRELTGPDGWARMRALAAVADPPEAPGPAAVREAITPFVDPEVAEWMDDGCFARWLLDALPTVDELLELAAALVTPGLFVQLCQVSGRRGTVDPAGAPADDPEEPDEPVDDPADGPADEPTGEPAPRGARGSSHAPR